MPVMCARNPDRRAFLREFLWFGATAILNERMSAGIAGWPEAALPVNVTDVHHHIYDSRFPADPTVALRPLDATVDNYRVLQKLIGITRHVAIQPSTYGTDNRCLLDALSRFGSNARGIAVVNTNVSDRELKRLNSSGVRGLRFNLVQAGATTPEMVEPLSKRIASLGWHIQVNASAEQIMAGSAMWNRLPVPIVFDHFGHVSNAQNPVFGLLCKMMQNGRAWTKLSGVETVSKAGPPDYSDGAKVAESFIKEAPDRLLWGTNWPHVTSSIKPDDVLLFNLLAHWTTNEKIRSKILVQNPDRLFGFH